MSEKQTLPRGIRLRGAKYFVDVSVDGKRKTATCETLDEAIAKKAELKDAIENGKKVSSRRSNARCWTLKEALTKTLQLPKPEGWRGISYEKQAIININDAMSFMGEDITLDKVTRVLIDAWVGSCEAKGLSDSTINRKISCLSKVLKVALNFGGLDALPNVPKFRKEPVNRIRQVTPEEERKLFHYCEMFGRKDIADIITILLDTGMRCSELWNVRVEDVDHSNRLLLIYGKENVGTKNGGYRSVPMTLRVAEILKHMERQAGERGGIYFDFTNSKLRHQWDRIRQHMGLTDDESFSPHVLRHTCCSRLVRGGVPMPVVQKWMGHKTITTTMRYAHLMPKDLMEAAKVLEVRVNNPA
ncbi:tyrosine-type recombinase/integrase [Pseudovibrio ascidiaceicola]|uniref:tyrosine-type recombinase/integrase n=1 Tax=Pseudovibrio ascidiaceicola TaxID=285279 RepID=UPI003D3611C3